MALAHADEIARRLIQAGRSASEPAAIVSDATCEKQRVRVTTLGKLGEAAREITAPAIFVIGENVRLRAGLDWLGALSGRRLDPDPLKREALSRAS
jgi:uroporphyrin-III C-methyltransferase